MRSSVPFRVLIRSGDENNVEMVISSSYESEKHFIREMSVNGDNNCRNGLFISVID